MMALGKLKSASAILRAISPYHKGTKALPNHTQKKCLDNPQWDVRAFLYL